MEECKYKDSVIHSYSQHQMEVSGQVRILTTYPLGNSTWQLLNRKMGELQGWSACFREKKISCTWQESKQFLAVQNCAFGWLWEYFSYQCMEWIILNQTCH